MSDRKIRAVVTGNGLRKSPQGRLYVMISLLDASGVEWEKKLYVTVGAVKFTLETLLHAFGWDYHNSDIETLSEPVLAGREVEMVIAEDRSSPPEIGTGKYPEVIQFLNPLPDVDTAAIGEARRVISDFLSAESPREW